MRNRIEETEERMSKGDNNWDFDPSSEDEFIKNIERALQEEIEEQRIEIDLSSEIQIIDDNSMQVKVETSEDKTTNVEQSQTIESTVEQAIEDNIEESVEHNIEEPIEQNIEESIEQNIEEPIEQNIEESIGQNIEEPIQQNIPQKMNDFNGTEEMLLGKREVYGDDFALLEEAVHRVASIKIEEDIDKIKEKANSEETIVEDITKSLAKQEDSEIKKNEITSENIDEKKKRKLWIRIAIPVGCVVMSLLLLFIFFRYTTPGQNLAIKVGAWFASSKTNYDDGSTQEEQNIDDEIASNEEIEDLEVIQPEDVDLNIDNGIARHEDYATNILLLGEETIDSGTARGRTDVMLILTLNSKEKTIKLTSLMRDMYVQIPGHLDNKLNSAYATGGIQLLYDTIELNFNIKLDGYALVGFNDFEKIIDLLGGVDISLTKAEADWLNSTNYISNPAYRTVVAGMNHMNGNQALGYCRIRDVGTADREYNDFGRTSRHRIVLDTLFHKYKSLGIWDLALIANSCLPMVTTDLDSGEIENCLRIAVDIGLDQIEQNRIPAYDTFENVTIRKMNVIVPDLTKNVENLHKFIFGEQQ